MTDEMMAWLRAQLDEDERVARATSDGPWFTAHILRANWRVADADAEHIARHDPARVLRRVEVNRLILDKHGIIWRDIGWLERDGNELIESYEELPVCVTCVPKHSSFPTRDDVPTGPCLTVRLLASTYSGRPDYRAEWAL